MKIRSTIITREDIYRTLHESVSGASIDEFSSHVGRDGRTCFTVYAESFVNPRARNGRPGHALTYDDYGYWFARLFAIDPDAHISGWNGLAQFNERTEWKYDGR